MPRAAITVLLIVLGAELIQYTVNTIMRWAKYNKMIKANIKRGIT